MISTRIGVRVEQNRYIKVDDLPTMLNASGRLENSAQKTLLNIMAVLTSVLVIGPTGSVGTAVCNALIERKTLFKRIAAFNNTDRSAGAAKRAALDALAKGGMEIVSGTYGDVEAFKGFDAVLMPLGNFGNYLQPQVIDTAVTAGVRHFYPSEFGADITVGENWAQRYYRDKVLTREHLQKRDVELGERGEGLGWSYVCIGRFTEWSIYPRFGWNHVDHTAEVYGNENGRQSLIGLKEYVQTLNLKNI